MKQKRNKNLWEEKSARIASKIRDTLGSMNIAQAELAKSLNVSRQHVNKILKGKENLTIETIARIEDVLGVTLIVVDERELTGSRRDEGTRSKKRKVTQAKGLNPDHLLRNKIKPIIYRSFEEKERLEKELMAITPKKKRKEMAVSLMSIFHASRKLQRNKPNKTSASGD